MANGEDRNLRHFFLRNLGERMDFVSPRRGGDNSPPPARDRVEHANMLEQALTNALEAVESQRDMREADKDVQREGFFLEFEMPVTQRPMLDKLEDRRGRDKIELVSVRRSGGNPEANLLASVYVPESKREVFGKKIREYREMDTGGGLPKNEPLVASIEAVRHARSARSLYTDEASLFPQKTHPMWWEIWIRVGQLTSLQRAVERLGGYFPNDFSKPLKKSEQHPPDSMGIIFDQSVQFAEREVVIARATPNMLDALFVNCDVIAELRLARDTPSFFLDMSRDDQREWVEGFLQRVEFPEKDAPAICILDSGSTREHPLIGPALESADQTSWNGKWAGEDIGAQWRGHGTKMSGLALYGDLFPLLDTDDPVPLTHGMESIKILPDHAKTERDLFGHITVSAVGAIETQSPNRKRVYCLGVTDVGTDLQGAPTSWSAKIDDLCHGDGNDQRLIIVSAGNIRVDYPADEYLDQNDATPIESPAQAWNSLTVGAFTEKCVVRNPEYPDLKPLAPTGDLSPSSRTSVS